jgi:hypothetical protein
MVRFLEGEKSECIAWLKADAEMEIDPHEKTDVYKYQMTVLRRHIKYLFYPVLATATIVCLGFMNSRIGFKIFMK